MFAAPASHPPFWSRCLRRNTPRVETGFLQQGAVLMRIARGRWRVGPFHLSRRVENISLHRLAQKQEVTRWCTVHSRLPSPAGQIQTLATVEILALLAHAHANIVAFSTVVQQQRLLNRRGLRIAVAGGHDLSSVSASAARSNCASGIEQGVSPRV